LLQAVYDAGLVEDLRIDLNDRDAGLERGLLSRDAAGQRQRENQASAHGS
jgi:hypothetical protein